MGEELALDPSLEDLARGLSPAESFALPRALTGLPSGGVCGVEERGGVGVLDRGETKAWTEAGDPDGEEFEDEDEMEELPMEAGATKLGSLGRTNWPRPPGVGEELWRAGGVMTSVDMPEPPITSIIFFIWMVWQYLSCGCCPLGNLKPDEVDEEEAEEEGSIVSLVIFRMRIGLP